MGLVFSQIAHQHNSPFLSIGAHCYGQGTAYFPFFCLQMQQDGDTGAPQKEIYGPEIQYSACDLSVQGAEPFTRAWPEIKDLFKQDNPWLWYTQSSTELVGLGHGCQYDIVCRSFLLPWDSVTPSSRQKPGSCSTFRHSDDPGEIYISNIRSSMTGECCARVLRIFWHEPGPT